MQVMFLYPSILRKEHALLLFKNDTGLYNENLNNEILTKIYK